MAINTEKAMMCLADYNELKTQLMTMHIEDKLMEQLILAQLSRDWEVSIDSVKRYLRYGRKRGQQLDDYQKELDEKLEGQEADLDDVYWDDSACVMPHLNALVDSYHDLAEANNLANVDGKKVLYIPDTQIKVGADTEHIRAAARYAVSKKPDVIVFAGDFHDMESLSVFNSRKDAEGLRVADDIKAGNDALDQFMEIIYSGIDEDELPEIHITLGNHSAKVRIERFYKEHPHLIGMIEDTATAHFKKYGIIVHDFLDILNIEGIRFSHYITNPHSLKGSPLGGACDTMLKNAGFSFVMGHQQGLKMTKHYLSDGTRRIGIVAGSFYPHDEDYMSIQANKHWRGIIMLHEVKDGGADICEVSLGYLMKTYGDK